LSTLFCFLHLFFFFFHVDQPRFNLYVNLVLRWRGTAGAGRPHPCFVSRIFERRQIHRLWLIGRIGTGVGLMDGRDAEGAGGPQSFLGFVCWILERWQPHRLWLMGQICAGCGTYRCLTPWRPKLNQCSWQHYQLLADLCLARMTCRRAYPELRKRPSLQYIRQKKPDLFKHTGCLLSRKEITTSCSCRLLHCCPTIPTPLPYLNLMPRLLTSHLQQSVLNGTTAIARRLRYLSQPPFKCCCIIHTRLSYAFGGPVVYSSNSLSNLKFIHTN
jgi:hypothetical protein